MKRAIPKKRLEQLEYKKLKLQILLRDKYACIICKIRQNLHIHHIIYRSHAGTDTLDNLVTLCVDCHTSVHNGNPLLVPKDNNWKVVIKSPWKPKYKVV